MDARVRRARGGAPAILRVSVRTATRFRRKGEASSAKLPLHRSPFKRCHSEARAAHHACCGDDVDAADAVHVALIEAKSKEEAVEFSRRFWQVAGDGAGEIYEVFGG